MLNLSQLYLNHGCDNFFERIKILTDPDIYLAENIQDYQINIQDFSFPWYKKFPLLNDDWDRAYVVFHNIRLNKVVYNGEDIPFWFRLHDSTGDFLVYWNKNHSLFPSLQSFDEAQENQGLKNNDWVYDVFIRHIRKGNLANIVDVKKYKSSSHPEKNKDYTRLKSLISWFEPELIPAN